MHQEEIEVKFLGVDVSELEKKLSSYGAEKVGDYFLRRYLIDFSDFSLEHNHSWLRLRTDGEETTLTYKKRLGVKETKDQNDDGMQEIETHVEDFEKTKEILLAMGMMVKRYEENKRTKWKKGSLVFDIDVWPRIPPFVEIEGDTWGEVEQASKALGFDWEERKVFSPKQAYTLYGIDLANFHTVMFEHFISVDGTVEKT